MTNKESFEKEPWWSIQDLNLIPGLVAAFEIKGRNWFLRCWQRPDYFANSVEL